MKTNKLILTIIIFLNLIINIYAADKDLQTAFQFHNGSIKRQDIPSAKTSIDDYFNSTMVRLKVQQTARLFHL